MRKNYRVECEEVEVIHYFTVKEIEAESEENAREGISLGGGLTVDSESYDYSELSPEVAEKYANGKLPLLVITKVELAPTQKDIDNQKLVDRRTILEKQIENINKQIKY